MKQIKSLKAKILFSFMAGITLLFLLITGIWAKVNRDISYAKATEIAKKEAFKAGYEVEYLMKNSMSIAKNLAITLQNQKINPDQYNLKRDEVMAIMKTLLIGNKELLGIYTGWEKNTFDGKDSEYTGVKIYGNEGRFVPYITRGEGGKIDTQALASFNDDWYKIPKEEKRESYSDLFVYEVQGVDVLMTSLTTPILVNGNFVGMTGVDIALSNLQKLSDNIEIYNNQGRMILLSASGKVAGHTGNAPHVGKSVSEVIEGFEKSFSTITQNQDPSIIKTNKDLEVYIPINLGESNKPWYVGVKIPNSVIESPIIKQTSLIILYGLIGMVLVSLVIFAIINKSYKKLALVEGNLKNTLHAANQISSELQDSSNTVSEAATQQASSIQETVTTLDEISAMSEKSADFAKQSLEKASYNEQKTLEGKSALDNMINAINEISDSNDEILNAVVKSNDQFQKIIDLINEISNKTQIINDIVFQTRLLSFNASVEAARAGEHGKGFAIVAEEIGTLANVSGKAAVDICEMVDNSVHQVELIVKETSETVTKMVKQGKTNVDNGVQIANNCQEAFDGILKSVKEINYMIDEISSAASEQSTGVKNISDAIGQIDQSIHFNSEVASKTADLGTQMLDQANQLEDAHHDLQVEIYGKAS